MLRDSLDCLVSLDATLARQISADQQINRMKRVFRDQVEDQIRRNPDQLTLLLKLLGAVRNLERVADLATNIAEDVVYLVEGTIIRHQGEAAQGPPSEE